MKTFSRRRLELASRGHKLLKNKQEKLMQNFIALARETSELRRRLEKVFMEISMHYLKGRSVTGRQRLEDALALTTMAGTLETGMRSEMNVRIPEFTFKLPDADPAYGLAGTSVSYTHLRAHET